MPVQNRLGHENTHGFGGKFRIQVIFRLGLMHAILLLNNPFQEGIAFQGSILENGHFDEDISRSIGTKPPPSRNLKYKKHHDG
jgi:hypothetical protein